MSVLLLSTGVEQVAIRFRKPDQRSLERVTVDEARQYLAAGEFAAGSMGPKIEAAIAFLEHDGRDVVITSPDHLADAVAGRTGTHLTAHGAADHRSTRRPMASVKAEPYEFEFEARTTALVMIDFQRDFVDPGGFGEALGNDVALLRRAVPPAEQVLKVARAAGLFIVHTREGHRSDLADCPPAKKARGRLKIGIGDPGPMGRILVRGEAGHDIVKELAPAPGEPVVDKPGKGAFYATDLHALLENRHIAQLVVCGVTTEVCVNTTVREANDRGYDCLVLEDCVASYFPELHQAALAMVKAQGGIFGWVSDSRRFLAALGHAR